MPLVRISLSKGKPPAYIRAIADNVHRALVECFATPADDRFQLISQHERDELIYNADYLGIHRTDDVVFINIIASKTRSTATKAAFYQKLAELLAEKPGLRPEDVQVIISPNEREDWSFGKGLASYVKSSVPASEERA
jgi:phenylpyruvate tautomerase PptA (4-oxalocrotonate tautomerase family)